MPPLYLGQIPVKVYLEETEIAGASVGNAMVDIYNQGITTRPPEDFCPDPPTCNELQYPFNAGVNVEGCDEIYCVDIPTATTPPPNTTSGPATTSSPQPPVYPPNPSACPPPPTCPNNTSPLQGSELDALGCVEYFCPPDPHNTTTADPNAPTTTNPPTTTADPNAPTTTAGPTTTTTRAPCEQNSCTWTTLCTDYILYPPGAGNAQPVCSKLSWVLELNNSCTGDVSNPTGCGCESPYYPIPFAEGQTEVTNCLGDEE